MTPELSEQYVKYSNEIYNDKIAQGMHPEKAQTETLMAVSMAQEIIEGVIEDTADDHWYCQLRVCVPTKHIEGWWNIGVAEKEVYLWGIGVNIHMQWREREGTHLGANGRPDEGFYVEGSERLDKEWIESGNASWDAVLEWQGEQHGAAHKRDLMNMGKM